ncbi:MAG TPA: glycosyltransferase family 2 protein [Polyangiales bacterium]
MINGKRIAVVLPAYNAEKTLERCVAEIPREFIDDIIIVDDASHDETVAIAKGLGLELRQHPTNLGYGGNQKTCYRTALERGADVVIMLHPDYQYDPRLLVAMAAPICYGVYDTMLGSRILGNTALSGGMPVHKYVVNRALTFFQNLAFQKKLSEYHTGYRAFDRKVLLAIPFERNSNDFVFDSQMLAQIFAGGFRVGEVSCPTKYFPEASSIGFMSGVRYAWGCVVVAAQYVSNEAGASHVDYLEPRDPNEPPDAD